MADGLPRAFVEHHVRQYGQERCGRLLASMRQPTRHVALINTLALDGAHDLPIVPASWRKVEWCHPLVAYECTTGLFEPPVRLPNGLLPYYLLDAASLLPVLALGVRAGDKVLDLCAAPGGKSVAIAQFLFGSLPTDDADSSSALPIGLLRSDSRLTSNEKNETRRKRLQAVLGTHIPAATARGSCTVMGFDGTLMPPRLTAANTRVLVDAPCSSDRHLVHAPREASAWSMAKVRQTAKLQVDLLRAALEGAVDGGVVVYSTCALSREENDDVVRQVLEKHPAHWGVKLAHPPGKTWPIGEPTELGWIVLPDNNDGVWGPIYFAVLERTPRKAR